MQYQNVNALFIILILLNKSKAEPIMTMRLILHYFIKISLNLILIPLRFHVLLHQGLLSSIWFKSITKATNKSFPRATLFCPGNFTPKHLHNPPQSLVFDLARNVPTKIRNYIICKSAVSFEPIAVNVNFAPVSVCQCVNVFRSVFCHPHVSFLAKPLFPTVNLVRPVTVYIVKPVNSAHHICRLFPSVHCTTSIHGHFLIGGIRMLQ